LADNYNYQDILAEIELKKAKAATSRPAEPARPAEKTASPFNMRGMEEQPAQQSVSPFSKQAELHNEATRTDLPTVKTSAAGYAVSDRTQVMPAINVDTDPDFEENRRKKVQQFMQDKNSFASDGIDAHISTENDKIEDLGQFFGGLKRRSKGGEPQQTAVAEKKPRNEKSKKSAGDAKGGKKPKKAKSGKSMLRPVKEQPSDAVKKSPRLTAEAEDDGEYNQPSDARDVKDDIRAIKKSLTTRVAITGICSAVLLYLSLANLYPIPLLNAICPEVDMKVFLLVNLMVTVIAALAANAVIGNGLLSFFKFKADYDAPAALCTLAVIAHGVALAMNSDMVHTGESGFYFFIASMSLFANSVGKRMMISRIEKNFAVASSKRELQGEYIVDNADFAQRLARGQGFADPSVAYSVPIGFPEKFLKLSYSEEYTENLSRYISHFFALAAVILALVCKLFFDSSGIEALTIFCVVLCMASPLTPTIVGNLPLLRAAKRLSPKGAFISGYDAVEAFEDMNCVTVKATELYPKGAVELHGIKPLAQSRIDEAILDAVSVSCRVNGLLSEALLNMIGGNKSILLPVDEVSYENAAGISAMVNGKHVLIGRRSLMEKYEVPMPPADYEKKFTKGGKKVLFVANSGAVTAMLIVSYRPGKKAAAWVNALGRKEMGLIVYTNNPNITAKKISADFHYPDEFIRVMSADLHDEYAALTAYRERDNAYIVSPVGSEARLHALAVVHSIKQSIVIGTVLQMAGLILGYALTAFLAFSGAIETLGFGQLAVYQLFWAVAAIVFSNLKKI